jgi:hypothetical protein
MVLAGTWGLACMALAFVPSVLLGFRLGSLALPLPTLVIWVVSMLWAFVRVRFPPEVEDWRDQAWRERQAEAIEVGEARGSHLETRPDGNTYRVTRYRIHSRGPLAILGADTGLAMIRSLVLLIPIMAVTSLIVAWDGTADPDNP